MPKKNGTLIGLFYFCAVERLSQYIENLLVKHEYAIIPDFGGFVIQVQSAIFNPDCITAPYAGIGFNPLMQHNDGMLAIEIARTEKLNYRQAMEFIQNELINLRMSLKMNDIVQFGRIGYFRIDSSENIIFNPTKKVEFLAHNFGLNDLYIPLKKLNSEPSKVTISFTTRNFYRYAAIAMLIFGLFFFAPKVSDVKQQDYAGFSSAFLLNQTRNQKNEPADKNTELATENPICESVKRFHVVVASLPTQQSAEIFCNELIDNDFNQAHVLTPIKTYRVAIQSFCDKDEAITYMENLRKSDKRYRTAWVLCDK